MVRIVVSSRCEATVVAEVRKHSEESTVCQTEKSDWAGGAVCQLIFASFHTCGMKMGDPETECRCDTDVSMVDVMASSEQRSVHNPAIGPKRSESMSSASDELFPPSGDEAEDGSENGEESDALDSDDEGGVVAVPAFIANVMGVGFEDEGDVAVAVQPHAVPEFEQGGFATRRPVIDRGNGALLEVPLTEEQITRSRDAGNFGLDRVFLTWDPTDLEPGSTSHQWDVVTRERVVEFPPLPEDVPFEQRLGLAGIARASVANDLEFWRRVGTVWFQRDSSGCFILSANHRGNDLQFGEVVRVQDPESAHHGRVGYVHRFAEHLREYPLPVTPLVTEGEVWQQATHAMVLFIGAAYPRAVPIHSLIPISDDTSRGRDRAPFHVEILDDAALEALGSRLFFHRQNKEREPRYWLDQRPRW